MGEVGSHKLCLALWLTLSSPSPAKSTTKGSSTARAGVHKRALKKTGKHKSRLRRRR